jgi:tetratricopeptide (TPR) repeat protein
MRDGAVGVHALFSEGVRNHQAGRLAEAETYYRQVLARDPRHADCLHLLGLIACASGDGDAGIALIGRAIAANANFPAYHYNLGVALGDRGDWDAAIASYRRAIRLKPDYLDAHNNLGNALKELGKLEDAIACYRRVVALNPRFQQAHTNLGNAHQIGGRFPEAIAAYEAAIALGGDIGAACHGLSNCRKFSAGDRPLIGTMQAALEDPRTPAASRALLHFALGKASDDLADFAAAIRHFDDANRIESATRRFDAADFTATVDWLISAFPAASPPPTWASPSELPVFVVGMPRSGTTLVEQILASHPRVSAGGELAFWLKRLDGVGRREVKRLSPEAEQAAIGDYLTALGRLSAGALRVIDKMPFNFLLLGYLHRLFPQARIVHCRRNPADTALSLYFTRLAGVHDFAYRRADIVSHIRDYQRLMAHWRTVLPPDSLLELDYEALVGDPASISHRLVAFCGLAWDEACLDFHKTERPIATASAWQARQPIYRRSAQRWRNYEPWLGEFRALLPGAAGAGAAHSEVSA